jgi:hypothetical protein
MIHVLKNLTSDYQIPFLESRFGDVEQPLTVSEISVELSLRFARINIIQIKIMVIFWKKWHL